jgi:hypothetical protein
LMPRKLVPGPNVYMYGSADVRYNIIL